MNSVQIHLALTHVPVILCLLGLAMLITALIIKNNALVKTAYILLLIAGISVLPVYFTGEGAEETVEHLPGVSEALIEEHEDMAKFALVSILATGTLALATYVSLRWIKTNQVLKIFVILLGFLSAGLMIQTAHLGGQVRHSEIRKGAVATNNPESTENTGNTSNEENENDD